MIHVTVYDNEDGQYMGFVFQGHAGFGAGGQRRDLPTKERLVFGK